MAPVNMSDVRELGQEATRALDALAKIGKDYHGGMAQGQAAMLALKEALKLKHLKDRADGMELEGWKVIWRLT